MRSRKSFFKKLILSGATAVSVIGFASPAVFAWDGGSYNSYGNYNNNYSNSYRCDRDWDWDDSNCMRLDNYSYSNYDSYHNNYNNNCDHRYSNMYW